MVIHFSIRAFYFSVVRMHCIFTFRLLFWVLFIKAFFFSFDLHLRFSCNVNVCIYKIAQICIHVPEM